MSPDMPVMRDPDAYIYCKEEVGGLVMGGFEPAAKPWRVDPIPERFEALEDEVRKLEKLRMTQALLVGGSQAAAAELLKMPLRTFQAKAKQYGLRKKDRD